MPLPYQIANIKHVRSVINQISETNKSKEGLYSNDSKYIPKNVRLHGMNLRVDPRADADQHKHYNRWQQNLITEHNVAQTIR